MELNQQQKEARDLILLWYELAKDEKQCFTLAGYAGTGKTFLINHIIKNELKLSNDDVAFIAPTGKAACVLIQRGATSAQTIHRLIYNRVEVEYTNTINGKDVKSKRMEFVKKPSIKKYKLIILDEVSMVDEKTLTDLLSFGIPVICCGDSGQLPAIGKPNSLLDEPDYLLTEIVRQDDDNAIVKIAEMARNGQPIPVGNYGNVQVYTADFLPKDMLNKMLIEADQVLCGTNRLKYKINKHIKKHLNYDLNSVNVGEKVICTLNNWDIYLDDDQEYSLVNGVIGTVVDDSVSDVMLGLNKLTFVPDFLDGPVSGVLYDINPFLSTSFGAYKYEKCQYVYLMGDGSYKLKAPFLPKTSSETMKDYLDRVKENAITKRDAIDVELINMFEPAFCISVHKSQGSEWDYVVVFDESSKFEQSSRWLYTAITRAKKRLVIIK